MELWDLFDENRRFLYKQHNRQEPLAPGHYHVVVVVCVVNSKEEILVTLRHPAKETYANCWENYRRKRTCRGDKPSGSSQGA